MLQFSILLDLLNHGQPVMTHLIAVCGYVHCVEVCLAIDCGPPLQLFLVLLIGYVSGMYMLHVCQYDNT